MDFRGFDSSTILIFRGGILMSVGDLPESLRRAILVGVMSVGRSGVARQGSLALLVHLDVGAAVLLRRLVLLKLRH